MTIVISSEEPNTISILFKKILDYPENKRKYSLMTEKQHLGNVDGCSLLLSVHILEAGN